MSHWIGFFISDEQNAKNISLNGQTVVEDDEVTVTISLDEVSRIAALLVSDTPGGMALALFWTLNLSRLSILDRISTIWRNL